MQEMPTVLCTDDGEVERTIFRVVLQLNTLLQEPACEWVVLGIHHYIVILLIILQPHSAIFELNPAQVSA